MAVGVAIVLLAGCATGRAYRSGQQAAKKGDWDAAVAYYREALLSDPSRVDIKIALQRATLAASAEHMARAKELIHVRAIQRPARFEISRPKLRPAERSEESVLRR